MYSVYVLDWTVHLLWVSFFQRKCFWFGFMSAALLFLGKVQISFFSPSRVLPFSDLQLTAPIDGPYRLVLFHWGCSSAPVLCVRHVSYGMSFVWLFEFLNHRLNMSLMYALATHTCFGFKLPGECPVSTLKSGRYIFLNVNMESAPNDTLCANHKRRWAVIIVGHYIIFFSAVCVELTRTLFLAVFAL